MNIAAIPETLRALPQWVAWRAEERNGKTTKVPYDPKSGTYASSTNPRTWASFEEAVRACNSDKPYGGIGFVLAEDDPYVGIDLDKCRNAETGELQPWAQSIVGRLSSYTEVSPSGRGLHIFVRGALPPSGNSVAVEGGKVELYDEGRYLTVTGEYLSGTPTIADRQAELEALHAELFPEGARKRRGQLVTVQPTEMTDNEVRAILDRAFAAKNGEKVRQLWEGHWKDLDYTSQSEADLALASSLYFWTSGALGKVDALFRRSALYRAKWDEVHYSDGSTYGQRTLAECVGGEVYKGAATTKNAEARFTARVESVRTLRDRLERPTEIPHPLIPDLIWPGAITMLFGPTGVGKTTALVNLALQSLGAVGVSDPHLRSQERPVNLDGGLPYPARPLRVLYLGAEDSLPMFEHLRLTPEVMAHYRVGPETQDGFHYLLGRITLTAPRPEDVQITALIQWIIARGGYDLVILDPITRFHTGLDENDNGQMGQVMAALDAIREQTGAAIVFAHHTGKFASRAISGNRLVRSDPTAARGASILSDQSHVVVSLTRGQGNVLTLTWAKCNYAPHSRPLVFERTDGGILRPVAGDPQLFEVQAIVERLGKGEPVGRSHVVRAVAEALQLKPSMARRWIGRTEEVAMILRVTKQGEPYADGDFVALPS